MFLLKPEIITLVTIVINNVQGSLSPDGENVCLKTERYETTVHISQPKKIAVNREVWCWDISRGFKCEKTIFEVKKIKVPQKLERSRIVPYCCPGYKENSMVTKCIPSCLDGCHNGRCTAPEICVCNSGFHGFSCTTPCPPKFWGENCEKECECFGGGTCDPVTGDCLIMTKLSTEKQTEKSRNTQPTSLPSTKESQTESSTQPTNKETYETNSQTESISAGTYDQAYQTASTTVPTTMDSYQTEVTTSEISVETFNIESTMVTQTSETSKDESTTQTTTIELYSKTPSTLRSSWFIENTTPEIINTQKTPTPMYTSTESITNLFKETETDTNIINKEVIKDFTKFTETATTEKTTTDISNTIETDNKNIYSKEKGSFVGDGKSTLNEKNKRFNIIHFVPTLTVVSGVFLLLFTIGVRYIIARKRRNVQKMSFKKTEKLYYPEEKHSLENVFSLSNFVENPVYLSEEEINHKTPVLQTFKPLNTQTNTVQTNETVIR